MIMAYACRFCGTDVEPTGVEDVFASVDSLDPACPSRVDGGDHIGDRVARPVELASNGIS